MIQAAAGTCGGYLLNSTFFKSADDIVAVNPHVLKFNLGVISRVEVEVEAEAPLSSNTKHTTGVPHETEDNAMKGCPVCLETFANGPAPPFAIIPCGHVFCETCITRLQCCAVCRVVKSSSVRIFI